MAAKAGKRWFITGRVQGVGFRYFVQHKATALGLTGWTRNLEDGRVEVYAVGNPQHLNDLAAALHQGPRIAEVRHVEESEAEVNSLSSFLIR
ncbi:MAG: acylphosphatase [Acidobacteriaceae bacterium]|nr:acylphosphatase [Acidobacteriaceae bacterium]MBV9037315.1 acylphosphatase [Acidobacteriaceae bacterium]MBV9222445.1 acylphosphatase [Acidobacteriaceae bacterium]MBV9307936.1 acylphosphatase [Acidobacteriaceae bacterium]MBV9675444.1 acylphosphatase [Acidobacteriaceae bacterium]